MPTDFRSHHAVAFLGRSPPRCAGLLAMCNRRKAQGFEYNESDWECLWSPTIRRTPLPRTHIRRWGSPGGGLPITRRGARGVAVCEISKNYKKSEKQKRSCGDLKVTAGPRGAVGFLFGGGRVVRWSPLAGADLAAGGDGFRWSFCGRVPRRASGGVRRKRPGCLSRAPVRTHRLAHRPHVIWSALSN